jgi:hypothetical protein
MARKMRKFSEGGALGKYNRRMADIKKDFAKDSAGKSGRALEVLEAKRAQRIADAEDDRAKRTGGDRTATRAAEKAAEANLTKTRKFGADKPAAAAEPAKTTAPAAATAETAKAKPQSFGAAFKEARARLGAGKTFTFNGKSFTTNIAGEGRKAAPTAGKSAAGSPSVQKNAAQLLPTGKSKSDIRPIPTTPTKATVAPLAAATTTPKPATAAKNPREPAKATGPSTKRGLNPNSIAGMIASGKLFETSDAFRKSQEAKYGKAKGGSVKKEKTMKYAKGGSTPPQPTAADRKSDAKFRESIKNLKVTPEQAAAIGRGNRSEASTAKPKKYAAGGVTKEMPSSKAMGSLGMAKGGKAKAKGKPFAATKFGAAMMKKSADTKGRAMPKFAKGGSIDGCAVKGKTKASMVKMARGGAAQMRGRDHFGGAAFKKGGKTC